MHKSPKNNLLKPAIVLKILLFCICFFSACSTKKPTIETKNRPRIHSFLNHFLFVNGGAYTLFGDKPISEMLLFVGTEDDLMELTEEELKRAMPRDDSIVEDWRIWKCYADKIPSKHFIIAERLCSFDPSHVIYAILNVDRVKEVLCKYRATFVEKIGAPFDSDQVIKEFKILHSSFWEQVFTDHSLSGLLFGYGEENIAYFSDHMENQEEENQFSDKYNPLATSKDFPIPIFAISSEDKTAAHYLEQRMKIQSIYRNKDIVDVTIQRLMQ